MSILFINGPPRAGKDTLARYLASRYEGSIVFPFARPLKEMVHRLYNLDVEWDHFEDCKDEPRDEFFSKTPREVYIGVSEYYMKPLHGEGIFGKLWWDRVNPNKVDRDTLIIVPDSGFYGEVRYVINQVTWWSNIPMTLVRLYREGFTFKNDSRSYLSFNDPSISEMDLDNLGLKQMSQLRISYSPEGILSVVSGEVNDE